MSRNPHCKSPRRAGLAAVAVFLLASPGGASAQGLFSLFGGPSSYEIERRLEASGYVLSGPLVLRGEVYLADVVARGEGPERLIIDSHSGRILQRFRARGDHWREAATPPGAWSNDPNQWNGPRPPADIAPGAPPDVWVPPAPHAVETPRAGPKNVEIKPKPKSTPKSTPVANVANPPLVRLSPAATAKPAAPILVKPAMRSTPAAPASARPMAAPSPAPTIQAAKADTPSAPAKPSAPAPIADPSAKIKAINDIPVTPPD